MASMIFGMEIFDLRVKKLTFMQVNCNIAIILTGTVATL